MVNDRQDLDLTPFAGPAGAAAEWRISDRPVAYPEAVAAMEARAAAIAAGEADEVKVLANNLPIASGVVLVDRNRIAVEVKQMLPKSPGTR